MISPEKQYLRVPNEEETVTDVPILTSNSVDFQNQSVPIAPYSESTANAVIIIDPKEVSEASAHRCWIHSSSTVCIITHLLLIILGFASKFMCQKN